MASLTSIFLGPKLLQLLRQCFESLEIYHPNVARFLCHIISARCPLEQVIKLGTHQVLHSNIV